MITKMNTIHPIGLNLRGGSLAGISWRACEANSGDDDMFR